MSEKKLTAKQKLFCENYVANGYKLQKAYMDAYPDANPATANKEAWKLMKREPINALINEIQRERFEALHMNANRIAQKLTEIVEDPESTKAEQMRALELIQKQMGLQTQKVDANVKQTVISIGVDEDE